MSHEVFISYSANDKAAADAVCATLEANRIKCWIAPRDILYGQKWPEAIARAISISPVMVLIFSAESNNSNDMANELILAMRSSTIVIPFKIDDIVPTGTMQYYLANSHWLDAMNPPTKNQLRILVKTVRPFIEKNRKDLAACGESETALREKEAAQSFDLPEKKQAAAHSLTRNKWPLYTLLALLLLGTAAAAGLFGLPAEEEPDSDPTPGTGKSVIADELETDELFRNRGNSAGNIVNNGLVTYADGRYFLISAGDRGFIYLAGAGEGAKTAVNKHEALFINVEDDWIYYRNREDGGAIYRIRTDGSEENRVTKDSAGFINVIDGWIYYCNYHDGYSIYRIRTDGSERTKLSSDDSGFVIVVDGWIYYVNLDDFRKIYRIRTDGSEREKVNDDSSAYINIADGWIYYVHNHDDHKIYRIRTDGSEREKISDNPSSYLNIAGDWVYYVNADHSDRIYRVRTDGSSESPINDQRSAYINIAGNRIYYMNKDDNDRLYSMDQEGGSRRPAVEITTAALEGGKKDVDLEPGDPEVEEESTLSKGEIGPQTDNSRKNPAGLNEILTVVKDHHSAGLMRYEIELIDVFSGEDAWSVISEASKVNDEPPEGRHSVNAL